MENDQIRNMIRKFISDRPRNTAEISAWIRTQGNSQMPRSDIASILEMDANIVRIGTVRRSGIAGREYPLSEWATDEWVAYHERVEPNKEELK